MMIDEAIKKYEENAKRTWNGKPTIAAEECQQMVEWLKDYKRLLGAIEDIRAEIEKRKEYAEIQYGHQLGFDKIYAYRACLDIIDRNTRGKEQG